MKINGSDLIVESFHARTEKKEKQENLTIIREQGNKDILQLSKAAVQAQMLPNSKSILQGGEKVDVAPLEGEDFVVLEPSEEDKIKISLIEAFLKGLTGKAIKINIPKIELKHTEEDELNQAFSRIKNQHNNQNRKGWGIIYDYHEAYQEKEVMSFSAQGVVKTADGKEIRLDLRLNMSREFMYSHNISIRAGDAKLVDPLVINFQGKAPELSTTKFSFDLDADGKKEQISFLKETSGFLCLDKNQDGVINDGRELFGPQTGDGFQELSCYDKDGNLWIDENDEIYDSLRIWTKDAKGRDHLLALGEIGIGAIYLGSVSSLFSLKDSSNDLLGQIKETSLFLKENGQAGTVQHVDFAV